MSAPPSVLDATQSPAALRAAGLRLGILLLLTAAAFRDECRFAVSVALDFSDWSHLFVLPAVVAAFVWCRRDDLRAAVTGGSRWGHVAVLLSALIWFAASALGLFGHLRLIALLVAVVGVVLVTFGRGVARICLPVFLMIAACLPLSERTMESATIAAQRASLRAGVLLLKAAPGVEASVQGMTLGYRRDGVSGEVGVGELRFGFRLVQAGFLIGLFVVFARRRPTWQIVLLVLASVPLVLAGNVLRVVAAALVTAYGGYPPVSDVPRNVSIVVGLVASFALFAAACWLLDRVARLQSLFLIEGDSADDQDGTASANGGSA